MGCKRTNRTACSGKMEYRGDGHLSKTFEQGIRPFVVQNAERKREKIEMPEWPNRLASVPNAHGDSEFATNKRVIKPDHLRSPTVIIGPYAMAPIANSVKFKYVLPFCRQFVETFAGQTEWEWERYSMCCEDFEKFSFGTSCFYSENRASDFYSFTSWTHFRYASN